MIKAIVIDDEKNARTALRRMLQQFCPEVTVTGEAQNAIEGLELLRREDPDLVFLDVEMPGGTGFDLLNLAEERKFATVFTTAHEQYTIPAIRSGAFDYLLKPINLEELRKAIARAVQQKKTVPQEKAGTGVITISNLAGSWFVPCDEIVCVEGDRRYSRFHLSSGAEHVVSRSLGELEEELTKCGFFRAHKTWLVNCSHVRQISRLDGGFAILSNRMEIEISRRRRADFLRLMEQR